MSTKHHSPRSGIDTAAGITLIVAGVVHLAYAAVMLVASFAGAALQVGGIVVQSVTQLNSPNAEISVNEEHAKILNAALNIGIFGSAFAIILIVFGILTLLHRRFAVWFCALAAFLCINLFVCHFSMSWFAFATIYVALGFFLVAYTVYSIRRPSAEPVQKTQASMTINSTAPS